VEFDPPDGPAPAGYVIDGPAPGDLPCEVIPGFDVCVAVFERAPGLCAYTLRAVDDAGNRGPASAEFCIERIAET
jgi:hypothetical protein